jgi:hypothetical protein
MGVVELSYRASDSPDQVAHKAIKKKPRATAGLKLIERMKKDPTEQGPEPQRLLQVPVWIATHV